MIVTNSILLVIGLGGLGWQVYRNVAHGQSYAAGPLVLNGLVVLLALGLLGYALRIEPDRTPPPRGRDPRGQDPRA